MLVGGEDKTIQFMESMSLMDYNSPLLKEEYAYGVVEHPFPLNCFLGDWYLGPDFYNAVKIGIVQYVCDVPLFFPIAKKKKNHPSFSLITKTCITDDTEDDMCIVGNDPPALGGLRRGEI